MTGLDFSPSEDFAAVSFGCGLIGAGEGGFFSVGGWRGFRLACGEEGGNGLEEGSWGERAVGPGGVVGESFQGMRCCCAASTSGEAKSLGLAATAGGAFGRGGGTWLRGGLLALCIRV